MKSENPTMKWHRGLKYSNIVAHPPMSLGRRYYRATLKRLIKQKKRDSISARIINEQRD